MALDPYRTPDRGGPEADPPDQAPPRGRDDAILAAVIFAVGAIGVAIGILSNGERTTEPSLGLVMILWVIHAAWRERRDRRLDHSVTKR